MNLIDNIFLVLTTAACLVFESQSVSESAIATDDDGDKFFEE